MDPSSSVSEQGVKDYNFYLPLHRAIIRGDWQETKKFFDDHGVEATTASINFKSETALHVAVMEKERNNIVRELVNLMPLEWLAHHDVHGYTALHSAVRGGNMDAIDILVNKDPKLLSNTGSPAKNLPIHVAAAFSDKGVIQCLISKHIMHGDHTPFAGPFGAYLVNGVLASHLWGEPTLQMVDVALNLVETYPNLAMTRDFNGGCPLREICMMRSSIFPREESFSWWQKLIYVGIPLKFDRNNTSISDTENYHLDAPKHKPSRFLSMCAALGKEFYAMLWKLILYLVPKGKEMADKKLIHQQVLKLVKIICERLESSTNIEATIMCSECLHLAAFNGLHEVVELIVETFPASIYYSYSPNGQNLFQLAAIHRNEHVFNIIYERDDIKRVFQDVLDNKNNNIMHLTATLAPPHKLNLVPGAALQMQRELQWFKEMENFVSVSRREWMNNDKKTSKMIFTEEHKQLKIDGEKWMKDTASSCSITVALIATVVFAAAFTLPGGIDEQTGIPLFWNKFPFFLFIVSDAISLFTSVTSLIIFLSILTSRYAEEDFLYLLPRRLCLGLITLFMSLTFMIVAFGSTLYIVFEHEKGPGILIPIATLSCLPISSFAFLQFPLLFDVVQSTYGPGIFGKKRGRVLH